MSGLYLLVLVFGVIVLSAESQDPPSAQDPEPDGGSPAPDGGSPTDQPRIVLAPPYYLISIPAETYILPILPYELDHLEPHIGRSTMVAHYEGHHENYRRKMNNALEQWREDEPDNSLNKEPILKIFKQINEVPEDYRLKLKNNIGGFINHALYWGVISPNINGLERRPDGPLLEEIEEAFGSYSAFVIQFSHEAMELFGSGYVWLVRDRRQEPGKQLSIMITKDQDSPVSQDLDPLLVIDVWEHAYYLQHQFRRSFYVTEWWLLVDWEAVDRLDQFWLKLRQRNKDEL